MQAALYLEKVIFDKVCVTYRLRCPYVSTSYRKVHKYKLISFLKGIIYVPTSRDWAITWDRALKCFYYGSDQAYEMT